VYAQQQQQAQLQSLQAPLLGQQAPQVPPGFYNPMTGLPSSWDQQSLASTFSTLPINQP